jgi:vitamin B12/bleomycin/antimicrobial peptide transport system ATP-binding/permease protein
VPLIDTSQRWDRELSEDEQQGLAFARLVLHKPQWVLIDEVLDALDEPAMQVLIDIFKKDLATMGVISIGRADTHQLFSRVLHLVKDAATRRLQPAAPVLALSK